ncbi:MAG: putative NAD/FAD-dependent oxidoreductase, partial [Rickettsiales bacterium]
SLREGQKSLFDANMNLGICGDWLISGRVENAFLSAVDLCKNINNERKGFGILPSTIKE